MCGKCIRKTRTCVKYITCSIVFADGFVCERGVEWVKEEAGCYGRNSKYGKKTVFGKVDS